MSTLRSRLIRLAYQNPEVRPKILPLLDVRVASYHWTTSDDEPLLELKNGMKLLVATMQAPKLTRKKSEPLRYEYIVMVIPARLHGPGSGRDGGFVDEHGQRGSREFRFETVEVAKKAAEKFADAQSGT